MLFPSEKQLQEIEIQVDSLIEYIQKGHNQRVLNRIASLRQWLDALEMEFTERQQATRKPAYTPRNKNLPLEEGRDG